MCCLLLFFFLSFFQFFNLHVEQLLFPFVHHQVYGDSLWILIPHSDRVKLAAAVEELVITRAKWIKREEGRAPTQMQHDAACLARIPFFSKCLFPPLSLLTKHGVRFYRVSLTAGQVLMAHGGFAHYGFSTSSGETLSLASNLFTQEWFKQGGPEFMVQYFEWVQQLVEAEEQAGGREGFEAVLGKYGITTMQLANALNICPPSYTCSLLHGVIMDLQCHLEDKSRCVGGPYALDPKETEEVLTRLTRSHTLLHQVRPFLREYYLDPDSELFQVCDCKGIEEEQEQQEERDSNSESPSRHSLDESGGSSNCPSSRRSSYADTHSHQENEEDSMILSD
jgi:hypothetical protein